MNQNLINAVIAQLDCENQNELEDTLKDIYNHGIASGFNGFIYFSDTAKFASENLNLIIESISNYCDSYDITISDFCENLFRDIDSDYKNTALLRLSNNEKFEYDYYFLNKLAWFACDEVAYYLKRNC